MDSVVLVSFFLWVAARVLIFDKIPGAIWYAATRWGGGKGRGRFWLKRVPAGGIFCAGFCALAAGAPVGQVAGRVVLSEVWGQLVAGILGLAPLRRRRVSMELLGLWGAMSVSGLPFGFGVAAVAAVCAVALPALHAAGCRAVHWQLGAQRASFRRAPDSMNAVSHAAQAVARVGLTGSALLFLSGILGVCAALHGALAASAVLRRLRRRRLPRGAYCWRARRASGRRFAPGRGHVKVLPASRWGRAGLEGRVGLANHIGEDETFFPCLGGGRAGPVGCGAWFRHTRKNQEKSPRPSMGGRAGPEGRGAGEDDKVETGEKFPVPPQRGRAGPEGCGAWVFSKWKGKEKSPLPPAGGRAGPGGRGAWGKTEGVTGVKLPSPSGGGRAGRQGCGASVGPIGGVGEDKFQAFVAGIRAEREESSSAGGGAMLGEPGIQRGKRKARQRTRGRRGALRYLTLLLLMRAGDVETNPGPSVAGCISADSRVYADRAAERGMSSVVVVDSGIQSQLRPFPACTCRRWYLWRIWNRQVALPLGSTALDVADWRRCCPWRRTAEGTGRIVSGKQRSNFGRGLLTFCNSTSAASGLFCH